jgi:hypothetical protein
MPAIPATTSSMPAIHNTMLICAACLPAAFDITFLRRMNMSAALERRLLLSGSPGEQT